MARHTCAITSLSQSSLPFLVGLLLWVELHPHKKVMLTANPQYPEVTQFGNKAFKGVIS